jgi:hypothetical protein
MKLKKSISLLLTIMIMLSCKKSELKNDTVNLAEELKGSVWAGEFKYTIDRYQELQPFSVVLNNDGTLTWTDFQNTRAAGTWLIDGNKINLKFPNGTTNSADITKEHWSNFSNPGANGFEIANITRSAIPTTAFLQQTKWAGSFINSFFGTYDAALNFGSGKTVTVISNGYPMDDTYTVEGAGIRISNYGYFVFLNNATNVKGYNHYSDIDVTWNLTKQ